MGLVDTAAPTVVLDTNVVLDWLVFRNAGRMTLAASIIAGELHWVATAAMRDELAHVLARGHLDAWAPNLPSIWAHWDRHCVMVATPAPAGRLGRLRCSDPNDQMFVDLAVAWRARWLLSHDRAVLKLARRLRDHGVDARPPDGWALPTPA